MDQLIPAVLIGIVSGSIYGLIALGIVLVFKTQRVVNFAQAEFATVGAFGLYIFHIALGLPYPLAAVLGVAASGVVAVLVERTVVRPLRGSRDVTVFVATAGVALFIVSLTLLVGDANIRQAQPLLPGDPGFVVAGLPISYQQIFVIAILLAVAGALTVFFKLPVGRALLAVSREPFAVRLAGISTSRLSLLVWLLGGLIAGVAGVTFAPTTQITPGLFTQQALFPALTGAVLGGLTSLPGAFLGGIVVGIVQSCASIYATDLGVPGPDTAIVFVMLIAVLFFRPQGLLAKEA
ncbi:MAG: branched-chain amino acid ABC transporter permease [Actinomycetota bacterium]|nr:branched-chain amino acid ABC transporter permease [Actinomycetota bacterium]